ncbi:hypothetical protein PIB30_080021 [Stylosanthes scabra]|uniref:Uncharacterized protein n=1 Tax=Stylosanthes scabra TaxID=79078 RepID=A0ABU6WS56_9FABA|nr:hypothetical protein [Stylosanthes scabra]
MGLTPPIRPLDRMGFVSYVTTIHNWDLCLSNCFLALALNSHHCNTNIFTTNYKSQYFNSYGERPEFNTRYFDLVANSEFRTGRENGRGAFVTASTTLSIQDSLDRYGHGNFRLTFKLAGGKYALGLDELASIWGLQNRGILFKGRSNPNESLRSYDYERVQRMLRVTTITVGKYSVGGMSTDHRLLHYMLAYMLFPRKGNHGKINKEDLIILWAMVEKCEINWPYLMAHRLMIYALGQLGPGLGHGVLWTKVFEYLSIDLSGEDAVTIDVGNAITSKHLNKMRRGPKAAVEEDVEADEEGPHPQGVRSVTQFPPELMESFTQGLQSFHSSWSENAQRVNRRLDGFETRLANHANEIRVLGNDMHSFYSRVSPSEDQGF